MPNVTIDNPIINSPFEEPKRHFRFDDDGITDEIVEKRRISSYFIPIAKPRTKTTQLSFDSEWTQDRIQENKFINDVRESVAKWRKGGYVGITSTSRTLLEYWHNTERERRLFFCQIEAVETAIFLTETANRFGENWIINELERKNIEANPLLYRIAFKMATGSGKTAVMAMLIAWQCLNKIANAQDTRFTDSFLIVTPGITIRDRLRVLLPNDPQNYYAYLDIVPATQRTELCKAKIVITNFHSFQLKEKIVAGKLTKSILMKGENNPFTESPDQMVRRVCRELGTKKNIIVINDEAHHCYRRKPDGEEPSLSGEDRKDAAKRDEEARVWISGLEAIRRKLGIKVVYDLSATPFFLRGSGYAEGTLFPWVVSDFSLVDAIESGIVKVPRVPVSDDSMTGNQPTYRDIWLRIRDNLPKQGRKKDTVSGEPKPPLELQAAMQSLYDNYEKSYRRWESNLEVQKKGLPPPVFIIVCNNTNVSKLVYDFIAGWEKTLTNGETVVVAGKMGIFNNEENGTWRSRPNTILIDSGQLESGEAMSPEFKRIAAREIQDYKHEYKLRYPGRDEESLTDEDLLREVMNTVGKRGKLGEHVKCVVSVSMLTEGWDATTVTHILGVRAFGTQLLCEQVVGRGLRRMSFSTERRKIDTATGSVEIESFPVEYAEVYGVPFSFIPSAGSVTDPPPGPEPTRVRALEERIACEITFPRLSGYRYDLPRETLTAKYSDASKMILSTKDIPTKVENAPLVGETSLHTLYELKAKRLNEVAFLLAKNILERYFRDDDGNDKPWLFPQILAISKQWLDECVECHDNAFIQMLLFVKYAHDASDKIYKAIVASSIGEKRLKPILRPYDPIGTTRYVAFDTIRNTYETNPEKCHVSHVVADTKSWEQKLAQTLEEMPEVVSYVKNHNLGFTIPYIYNGEEKSYIPDFIIRIDDGHGADNLLNMIIEVSGESRPEKAVKVSTVESLWIPAVNNCRAFGRWSFMEIRDPWNAIQSIREHVSKGVLVPEKV